MRTRLQVGLLCGWIALYGFSPAYGGPILSIVEQGGTTTLDPGMSYTFEVVLSGLDTMNNQTLTSLSATVAFDPTLLGTPTSISPGEIIPDTSGFLPPASNPPMIAGEADGTWDQLLSMDSTSLIVKNGVFFTFSVTPLATANGGYADFSLSFVSSTDAMNSDPNNGPVAPDPTPPPQIRVNPGANAVPEPSTFVNLFLGGLVVLASRRIRNSLDRN